MPRLYESLCRQTFTDFEWVIVDDGSVDDTKSLSLSLPKREGTFFPIRYFYQENGGKHRAINRGVREAQGELFFIADSDDSLPPDALEQVARVYETVRGDESFGGVCGLDGTFDGDIIGSGLPLEVMDVNSINLRNRYHVTGDMKEVFRTEVMREFPFPEIPNERFVPEMLVWNRIATKYKLRYFNRIIYLAEYQQDGITSGIVRARMQSPVASMMTYAEMTRYDIPLIQKVKAAVNFWRFGACYKKFLVFSFWFLGKKKQCDIPKLRWYYYLFIPLGIVFHWRDVL